MRRLTKEGSESFGKESLISEGVGTALVEDAADGEGVGEELGDVSPRSFGVDGRESSRVEKDVPVSHRNRFFVRLFRCRSSCQSEHRMV